MNSKYYISDNLFFGQLDLDKVWKVFIPYLKHIDDEIVIVHWQTEREFELNVSLFDITDFEGENPFKISISQKPFLEMTSDIYICNHYKLNENIYNIISTNWLEQLKSEHVSPVFVVKYKNQHQFMVMYDRIIALLDSQTLNLFNSLGFEFEEWNIKLNDTL